MRVALASALAGFGLLAQQQPGGNPGGTPNPGGNPGATTPSPGRGTQQPGQIPGQQRQEFPDFSQNRPVFIEGKVVMEDGTVPPEQVNIERVCGTVIRVQGYTDSKGRFSFQLGQNDNLMQDASMSSASDSISGGGFGMPGAGNRNRGFSERDLMNCEIRASLPGYRSDTVNLAGRRALDNPHIGTIVLHRLAKVEGFTFSATSAFAPKDAKKAFDKGMQALKKKNANDAQSEFQKAVDSYPKFAVAWYQLGVLYAQQNKPEEARNALTKSIEADEKYVNPYAVMARLAGAEQKWDDVAQYSSRAIRLNPYFSPDVYYLSAVANYNLKKMDDAEESAREAAKMDPQHRNPRINHLLGVILAQKQAYPEAADNMRTFLKAVPQGPDADMVKKQLAEVERLMAGPSASQKN